MRTTRFSPLAPGVSAVWESKALPAAKRVAGWECTRCGIGDFDEMVFIDPS